MKSRIYGAIAGVLLAAIVIGQAACTPNQIQTAEQLTAIILQDAPAVLEILAGAGVLSQPQLTQAQAAMGQAVADYNLVRSLIADFKAAPSADTATKIRAALADAQAHLAEMLAASRVLNPPKAQQIEGMVTLIINTSSQIAAIFPATPAPASVKKANGVRLISPKDFKAKFNNLLEGK